MLGLLTRDSAARRAADDYVGHRGSKGLPALRGCGRRRLAAGMVFIAGVIPRRDVLRSSGGETFSGVEVLRRKKKITENGKMINKR